MQVARETRPVDPKRISAASMVYHVRLSGLDPDGGMVSNRYRVHQDEAGQYDIQHRLPTAQQGEPPQFEDVDDTQLTHVSDTLKLATMPAAVRPEQILIQPMHVGEDEPEMPTGVSIVAGTVVT